MNKRVILIIGIAIAAVAIILISSFLNQNKDIKRMTLAEARVDSKSTSTKCLTNVDKVNISNKEKDNVGLTAILQIIDIPAGTNAQFYVNDISGNKVTGSLYYPTQYGQYNFTLEKTTSGLGRGYGYIVTEFTYCKL